MKQKIYWRVLNPNRESFLVNKFGKLYFPANKEVKAPIESPGIFVFDDRNAVDQFLFGNPDMNGLIVPCIGHGRIKRKIKMLSFSHFNYLTYQSKDEQDFFKRLKKVVKKEKAGYPHNEGTVVFKSITCLA